MKYFAYGMNTNLAQMAKRCPAAVSLGAAVLPNYEFRFACHADVLENDKMDVEGVLWDITDNCLASLDRLEGYPHYYLRKWVTVIHEGIQVQALVYYMAGFNQDSMPSDYYLEMLYEGYFEHGVDTCQIEEALSFIKTYYVADNMAWHAPTKYEGAGFWYNDYSQSSYHTDTVSPDGPADDVVNF